MSVTAMKIGTVLMAASGEPSKTPFYIAGGLLVAWAAIVSFLGLSRAEFPGTPGRTRVVMAISAILVLGATSMAVATSAKKKREKTAAPTTFVASGKPGAAPSASPPRVASGSATGSAAKTTASAAALKLTADPSGQLKYDKTSLSVRAGTVKVEFVNMSPSAHNVTIVSGARTLAATPTITGTTATVTARLKPGTYTYYCSVPGHRQAGMQGTLTVQ